MIPLLRATSLRTLPTTASMPVLLLIIPVAVAVTVGITVLAAAGNVDDQLDFYDPIAEGYIVEDFADYGIYAGFVTVIITPLIISWGFAMLLP